MTRVVSLLDFALVTAPPVAAHVEPGVTGSLRSGLVHPLLGTDHLLAMMAVGLLAGMRDQFARFVLPAAFVAAMAFGLGLEASGLALPYTEVMILSSIMILGGLLASGLSTSIVLGASLPGVFGLFHGAAHGLEMGSALRRRGAWRDNVPSWLGNGLGSPTHALAWPSPG